MTGLNDRSPDYTEVVKNKSGLENLKREVNSDQRTIQALSYLTTFARLSVNRDLDELFDGEVKLGEEELLAVSSLLEVVNGANTIGVLKTPRKMSMNIDWEQDYKYNLSYDTVSRNGKTTHQISSLSGTGTLPFNDTKLRFNYNSKNQIESLFFERPTNLSSSGGLGVDQQISLTRDAKGLVSEMRILRDLEVDNKLTITYNYLGKPELIEQTKLGALSDKMVFEYDEGGSLKSIIYIPALSLKHLQGLYNAGKQGNKFGGSLKAVKMAGEYIAFTTLKKSKGVDVIEVVSEDGVIKSTTSNLQASAWYYTKGFSRNTHGNNGELSQVYLQKEAIGPDDKKTLVLEY